MAIDGMARHRVLISLLSAIVLVQVRGFVAELDKGNIGWNQGPGSTSLKSSIDYLELLSLVRLSGYNHL